MSPPLEQKTCPDCGAIFYLAPANGLELPPHGCSGRAARPLASAQPVDPAAEVEPAEGAAEQPMEPHPGAGDQDLFHALMDQVPQQQHPQPGEGGKPSVERRSGELTEETANILRERGYVLTEDAHGLRISGKANVGAGGSPLSASDIVRMAAELDGGVKQAASLQTCPKCQARTPAGQAKCQWCGEPFPRTDSTG